MSDTLPQPPPPTDARATRQESDEPAVTTTTTTTPRTQGTIAPPSRQSRKDALLHHKHGRSNSHGRVAPSSNTTTTNTSSGNGNNNNRRHNHAVNHSKTRPMMRSVSNQAQQHPNDQKQHQNSSTASASTIATATTGAKSERRARTSTEQKTRRKPKFVCGDLADEAELSSDQQQLHQQLTHSHGAERVEEGEGEIEEGEGEKGVLEVGRALEHDGYRPYHSPRHKHDPCPASPSRHHISPHQAHRLQPTEVARRGSGGEKDSQIVSSHQGNLDLERGPNSESIPNNGQRPHPLPRPLPARPSKEIEETRKQPEIAAIRLKAPDEMISKPTVNTITTTASAAKTSPLQPSIAHANTNTSKTNFPSASSSTSSSSSEESDVAAIRAKLTDLALVGKENKQEQNRQGQQESDNRIPKDTAIIGKGKDGSEEVSRDNRETTTTTGQPKVPEPAVYNSSTSSTTPKLNPSASTVTAGSHPLTSQQQPAAGASATAAIMPPSQQLSKRLTKLLNPSLSATSLPSLSKTTSEPIVARVSPNHHQSDSLAEHTDDPSSNIHRKDSPLSQQQGQQRMTTGASTTSPAVDLVSKILNPAVATLGRSRSQSSLQAMFASALTGSPTSSPSVTPNQLQHRSYGSSTSLAGSVRSNLGTSSSGNGMGFMTSPPRVSDPNVYLISRFITPASQAALSSSAPKQKARPLSNNGAGSMAVKRRLPASLRMSSTGVDVAAVGGGGGGGGSTSATAGDVVGETPSSPGAGSTYSSNEGPTPPHSNCGTPPPPFSTSSFQSTNSPWSPIEAMSRTQQKLLLQRDSSHDELDEEEMSRRGKMHKEMERIQREYKCIRMTSDPVMESMARCFALQRERIEQQCQNGGGGGDSGGSKEEHGLQSRHKTF